MHRIQSAFLQGVSHRQYILFGEGVSDSHFSFASGELEFSAALEQTLLERGYHTIFTSPIQPYFSHLAENKRFFEPYLSAQSPQRILDSQLRALQQGPLGNHFLIGSTDQLTPVEERMGDDHVLRIFDAILSNQQFQPVCLVFINAETTLAHLEDQRTLSGILSKWNRLPSTNPNKIIYCFDVKDEEALREAVDQLQINAIKNLIPKSRAAGTKADYLCNISTPGPGEVSELIQARYRKKMRGASPALVRRISKLIAGEGLPLSTWIPRLDSIPELTKDSLRLNRWLISSQNAEKPALDQLLALIGLQPVKDAILDLVKWAGTRDAITDQQTMPLLNMVFTGPPGVGKTTVAKFLGEILHDCGLLEKGQLIIHSPTTLVADHVGGTAKQVNEAVDAAMGGVLFIDEAYGLADRERGAFVQEAVEAILHRMEVDHGKFIVILAGYQKQMVRLFRLNPGLERRFPAEFRLRFPPYTAAELALIFNQLAQKDGYQIDEELWGQLNRLFSRFTSEQDETAGNAGEAKNLFEAMVRKWRLRTVSQGQESKRVLLTEDLPADFLTMISLDPSEIRRAFQVLNNYQGLREVKSQLIRLARLIEYEHHKQALVEDTSWNMPTLHQVFVGNPGTGKTSIARLYGELLRACGYLRKGHTVEVSAPLLISSYAGDSGNRLTALVQEALDGVLFIDEAYALVRQAGQTNFEVIDTLTKAMEDFRNRLVVVVAGYPQEMSNFMIGNPGLRSRFADPLLFADLNRHEIGQLMEIYAAREGYELPEAVRDAATHRLESQQRLSPAQFGNARSVRKLFALMKTRLAETILHAAECKPTVKVTDIPGWNCFALEDLIDEGITVVVSGDSAQPANRNHPGIESWVMRNDGLSEA